jgi:hypothetical protein
MENIQFYEPDNQVIQEVSKSKKRKKHQKIKKYLQAKSKESHLEMEKSQE